MLQVFVRNSINAPPLPDSSLEAETQIRVPNHLLEVCEDHTAFKQITLREPWILKVLPLRSGLRFKQIGLGFDFGFNPVCVLVDSASEASLSPDSAISVDETAIHGGKYQKPKSGQVYQDPDKHDGLRRLQGDRLRGLYAMLLTSLGGDRAELTLSRPFLKSDPLMWELETERFERP